MRDEGRKHDANADQYVLGFSVEAKQQLEANLRFWRQRIPQFERDLETEPARIRAFYEVRAQRVEPVGLVYLWPETN